LAVGRFQVMATLQAARARVLGLPLESAFSWGLNRAIFYAAAKRGFKGGGSLAPTGKQGGPARPPPPRARSPPGDAYYLGDEMAFKADEPGELRFAIGGKTQSKEDFDKQVEGRFQGRFKDAWEESIDYVSRFDRETLLSGSEFFSSVYRPKRDELAVKWTEMSATQPRAPSTSGPVATRSRKGAVRTS
jgi:hypothetical protein